VQLRALLRTSLRAQHRHPPHPDKAAPTGGSHCTLEPITNSDRYAVRLGLRMVRGLANTDAGKIVTARADQPFASADDVWRRASVPAASLVKIAEADGFQPSLELARRDALWAIKALRDEPLPLFAAASAREQNIVPETLEPSVSLKAMTAGREVVEDYGHLGLTLRDHPLAFLREDLAKDRYVTCAEAMAAKDGRFLKAAGLVLVRQMPGSAKGVMFITIEDESGHANLVVWPKTYEKNRRTILTASMLGIDGRIQREGDVVHLIAWQLFDLSEILAGVAGRDAPCPLPHGRGDEFAHGGGSPDVRGQQPKGMAARDIYIPDLHIDTLKQKARNFR